MSPEMLPGFDNMKIKSFWDRTEGKVGKVGIVAILAAVGFLIFSNMGFIVLLLQNTLHAAILFCVIGAIVYMFLDGRIRNLIANIYKSIVRFITGIFVTIDPIGILKNYLDDLRKRHAMIDKQIQNLASELGKMNKLMVENDSVITKSKKMALAAQKSGQNQQLVLAVRKAGRKQNFNKTLGEVQERMTKLYNVLKKVSESVSFYIEDLDDEIKTRETEYKAIKAGHTAIKGAMSVFKGASQEELFNQAMDYVIEDTGRKVGEIDYFLEASTKFINGIDIENQMFEMDGLEMLEQWESQSTSLLDDKSKKKLLDGATAESIKTTLTSSRNKGTYVDILNDWKKGH